MPTCIEKYIETYPDGQFYTVSDWGNETIHRGQLAVASEDDGLLCIASAANAGRIVSALNAQAMLPAAIEDAAEDRGGWIAVLDTLTA